MDAVAYTGQTVVVSGGGLKLEPRKFTVYSQGKNPSFMAVRQQHMSCESETVMEYLPQEKGLAGVAVFQNEENNYVFGKETVDGIPCVVLYKADKDAGVRKVACQSLTVKENMKPISLKVIADGADYVFEFRVGKSGRWTRIADAQDGRILSTSYAGGFTGVMIGCYATSSDHIRK